MVYRGCLVHKVMVLWINPTMICAQDPCASKNHNENHTGNNLKQFRNQTGRKAMNHNRRDFMKMAGIGVAALSIGGMGMTTNVGAVSTSNLNTDEHDTDILIIGGGIAATFAAVKARAQGAKVTVVDKGYAGRSGLTPWFHGFAHNDPQAATKEEWHHGLFWATESISRADYIDMFLEDSAARWDELHSWVPNDFLPQSKGPYLAKQIEKCGATIINGVMITELLEKDGRVVGAIGIPRQEDKAIVFRAGAVILCTGAGTFKSPGWPASPNTFDGHIMAYKLGADIAGKEWNDFHMTSMKTPSYTWGNHGGAFSRPIETPTNAEAHSMRKIFWSAYDGVDPAGPDIGPPPVGAGGPPSGGPSGPGSMTPEQLTKMDKNGDGKLSTLEKMDKNGDGKLSATEVKTLTTLEDLDSNKDGFLQPDEVPNHMPHDGPGSKGPEVVGSALGAAEHRMDGIFPKDDKCWTGIDGLYAAGDAMCTGGVGTAGISSPGAAVQAARAGIYAAEYVQQNKKKTLSKTDIKHIEQRMFAARNRDIGYSPQWVTRALLNIMMPYTVLYVKKQDRLEAALTQVMHLKEHMVPRLIAKDPHELRLAIETENMIINAEMKLRASMFRKESRHSHFREDYPYRDDKNFIAFVLLNKDGANMKVRKWDIPKEWIPKTYAKMPYKEKYTDRYPGEVEYLKKHKL
jgi:succinate dehydrogenase/fumarate reductase flavoprotein subunit